jgi:tetratricopeptide (TPR) repeat protein
MHKGDRELGLKQLNHAISSTVFLKVEAILFMSLIQLNYEKDLNSAAIYAERLVKDYPGNILYQGHMINILLHQHRYDFARTVLEETASQEDNYSVMIRTFAAAFLAEKKSGDKNQARSGYMETIELAESFGPIADIYGAMAYMGLSRLHEREGLIKEAEDFKRKASRLTTYDFILEE